MSVNLPCIHAQTDKTTFLKSDLPSTVLYTTVSKTAVTRLMDLKLIWSSLHYISWSHGPSSKTTSAKPTDEILRLILYQRK